VQECKDILDKLGWESVDLKKQYDFQLEEKPDDTHEHCPVQVYIYTAAFKVAFNEKIQSSDEKIHKDNMQLVLVQLHEYFKLI